MFTVEKIQLQELSDFIKSDSFKRLEHKPISTLRVKSYLHNPNALQNDTVLYMAFDGDVLVGYRTIWRDVFYKGEVSKSFGWLSGNWVHDSYRRKGISTQLFNEVYADWQGELMYTNYAVNSKLLYDKTEYFQHIKELIGIRFYTRFCASDILVKKHKLFNKGKRVLVFFDAIANLLFDIRFWFFKEKNINLTVEKDAIWNEEIHSFLQEYKEKEFFKRGKKRYNWIYNYPWVNEEEAIRKESLQYFFSLYAKTYENNYYTFYDKSAGLKVFLCLSLKDGHLKLPYVYYSKENLNDIVGFLLNTICKKKIKTVLIYDTTIEKALQKKMFYMAKKTFYQNFFATKKLKITTQNIKEKEIKTGDGDVVFT